MLTILYQDLEAPTSPQALTNQECHSTGLGSVSTTMDRIYNLHCNKVVQAVIKEGMSHPSKVVQGGIKEDRLHHSKQEQAISKGDILEIWVIIIYIIQIGLPLTLNTNILEVGMITGMICGKLKEGRLVGKI